MPSIDRRRFLAMASGVLVAPAIHAQPGAFAGPPRTVVVLDLGIHAFGVPDVILLRLQELGWVEGRNIVFQHVGKPSLLRAKLAASSRGNRVDLIVALGWNAALEAARATATVPILFLFVATPIEQGLAASYARPGRNVTGISDASGSELFVKRLELLKRISPAGQRIAWIQEAAETPRSLSGAVVDERKAHQAAAASLGLQLRLFETTPERLDATLREVKVWRAQGLIVRGVNHGTATRAIEFALAQRIPAVGPSSQFVIDGGLISYHLDRDEHPRLAAQYIDYILRGKAPADLPIAMPSAYKLFVNLRTAKAIGIKLPQDILLRADYLAE